MHIISGDGWSWSSGATTLKRVLVRQTHRTTVTVCKRYLQAENNGATDGDIEHVQL